MEEHHSKADTYVDPLKLDSIFLIANYTIRTLQEFKMNVAKILLSCFILIVLLSVTAYSQRYAVTSGNWDDPIWADSPGGIAGSAATPTASDNISIGTGVVVTVNTSSASCLSVSFQDSTGSFALASGGILNVYGNFTIDSLGTAFTSWATGAKLRFTGSTPQLLSGFRVGSNSLDSTILMEVVVDKASDTLRTPGIDMKIGIGTSLDIVHGVFVLGYRDDINGRVVGASMTPTITIDTGGVFYMVGSLSAIRSGVSGSNSISKMVVKGSAYLATSSTIGICIDGVDVLEGAELYMESFSSTAPNNVKLDTINVKRGAQVYNRSTINFWNAATVMYLDTGATYKVTTSTTNFPPTFYNTGTVRYQRTAGDGSQTIVDMNYHRLEISFAGNKTWTLGGDRYIFDSLETNNSTTFILTAASPYTLNVSKALRLTSGTLNNSDPNVILAMADGSLISRATGTISSAPGFESGVNLRYTSTVSSVSTGPEVPASPSVLQDLSIICDTTTVTLTTPMTINGTLTLSNGYLNNDSQTLTIADAASIRRATGVITSPPEWAGTANVAYVSILSSVVTGNELPVPTGVLQTLSMESPENVTLNAPVTVNGGVYFERGMLYLGDNDITLAEGATFTGTAPSDTTMFVTNGSGMVKRKFSSPSSFTFPIGDTAGGNRYSPATVNFTSGTFNPGAEAGAKVSGTKHPQNFSTTDYINRYWTLSASGISGYTADAAFMYADHDIVGIEDSISHGQWNGAEWTWIAPASAATNELQASGLTTLNEFTGGHPSSGVYHFSDGWNLMSVPYVNTNMSKASLFPTAASNAFAYQAGYVVKDTLVSGLGYWLKYSGATDVPAEGFPTTIDTITVSSGWNIIGSLGVQIHKSLVGAIGTGVVSNYFKYDGGYQITDTLSVGKGFWVKVNAAGQLILSASTVLAKEKLNGIEDRSQIQSSSVGLNFKDAKGRMQALYLTDNIGKNSAALYEMPPLPNFPDGFDVRYSSNRFMEYVDEHKEQEYPVVITSMSYPVSLTANNLGKLGGKNVSLTIGKTIVPLKEGIAVQIPDNSQPVSFIVTSSGKEIPTIFSLDQNYPNPFNPSTTIRYSLPEESRVTIEIYTLLGQKLHTLLSANQPAGYHSMQWSPVNLPSGLYFYKIVALSAEGKSFSQVRKMLYSK